VRIADEKTSLSWVLVTAGRYDAALAVSERALAMDAKLTWVICNRALALLGLGRDAEALQAYRHAIAISPESEDFEPDIKALRQFLTAYPERYEGREALHLLKQQQARNKEPHRLRASTDQRTLQK
jgi:tetratricopeptide (TPR) repeat protein